jgi:SRSO17 transposase
MKKKEEGKRIPRAPREEMAELVEYMKLVGVEFGDVRREGAMERYLTGILTDHPNKNCETLGKVLPGTNQQRLQNLLTGMEWDEKGLNRRRIEVMVGMGSEGDGVLVFDPTDFPKQGKHSVGVARQYSGSLGKIANCQVTVNCHYAERNVAWPVNTRLYIPEEWSSDPERCNKAGIPQQEMGHKKRSEIALELLSEAKAMGVSYVAVVADAELGDDPSFLDALEAQKERYTVDVCRDFTVSLSPKGPKQRADTLTDSLSKSAWRMLSWREGSEGNWLSGSFTAVRCYRVDGQGHRKIGWLIAQRELPDGQGRNKWHWSNLPPSTPLPRLVEILHRRHHIEQFHQEAKTLLGWDQYQGRLWRGFHRNAIITMLAYSFLVWLEFNQRQFIKLPGRPRQAFSPSKGSSSSIPALYSSPHR